MVPGRLVMKLVRGLGCGGLRPDCAGAEKRVFMVSEDKWTKGV